MATKIVTKNSSTASAVPTASDLVQGELAVNVADKRLFTEDNAGAIVELGTNPSTIDINAGTIDGTAIGASSASTGAFTTLTATGLDVTGTATMDALDLGATTDAAVVSTTASNYQLQLGAAQSTTGDIGRNISFDAAGTTTAAINSIDNGTSNSQSLGFFTGNSTSLNQRLNIASNGDVSFYEDTGTTPKLFWDASAESLGIGTSSPTNPLHITAAQPTVYLETSGGGATDAAYLQKYSNDVYLYNKESAGKLYLGTNNATKVTLDSSGNVGIGTSSPSGKTHSVAANAQVAVMAGGDVSDPLYPAFGFDGQIGSNGGRGAGMYLPSDGTLAWSTGGSERMRIDSSGNLLVGTTVANPAGSNSVGVGISSGSYGGFIGVTRDGNTPVEINRKTSDGNLITLRKDGTSVGSIGTYVNLPYIGKDDVNLLFDPTGPHIIPRGTNGGARDAAINLGASANRFKDLYLSGGVYLGGTGAANKLDDYEEGTFTLSSSAGTLTYLYGSGSTYTKIGNRVIIDLGQLQITGVPNNSSVFVLTGLPFSTQGQSGMATAFVNTQFGTSSGTQWFSMYIESNQIYISKRNSSYLLTNADITGETYQFSAGGSAYRTA